jgi:L-alanine-DL-glutamate epimerase-like enolase superfamily enzyme
MKIVSVDPFYLRMPVITKAADGTQDTVLVRVRTDDGVEGWGESDASPLVSIAAYCCPMSHGNMINIRESLLGETLDSPEDVRRLHVKVLRNGLDIEQIHHAYSGADIALWDALGKKLGRPVYRLLGGERTFPKRPYASVLFGDTPEDTLKTARLLKSQGFLAAKFGWGPMGKKDADFDEALVRGARDGLGAGSELMIDAGWAWGRDVDQVLERTKRFSKYQPTWLEEPFLPDALHAYAELARRKPAVAIAAGESAATFRAAEDFIENGGLNFVQIDAGRIGGITIARDVCRLAAERGVTYVNHTFKSRLSLAAALHVFADHEPFQHLEYPTGRSRLAETLATGIGDRDGDGRVRMSEEPGLGVKINLDCVREFLAPVRIEIGGRPVFEGAGPL